MMLAGRSIGTLCSNTIILLISIVALTCLLLVCPVWMSKTQPDVERTPQVRTTHTVQVKTRLELRRDGTSVVDQTTRKQAEQAKETSKIRSQEQMPTGSQLEGFVSHETSTGDFTDTGADRLHLGDGTIATDRLTGPTGPRGLQISVARIPSHSSRLAPETRGPPRSVRSAEQHPFQSQSSDQNENRPTVQALVGHQLVIPCSGIGLDPTANLAISSSRPPMPSSGLASVLGGPPPSSSSSPLQPARARGSQLGLQPAWSQTSLSSGRHLLASGVSLIVWYKDGQLNEPIFVLDARNVETFRDAKQRIASNSLKGRVHFELIQDQQHLASNAAALESSSAWSLALPALVIDEATVQDSGLYTCDVEFPKAPTQTHHAQALVVDPPRNMVVRDESLASSQQRLYTSPGINPIGPHDEESNLLLSCEVEPGNPGSGYVSWWQLDSVLQINESPALSIPAGSSNQRPAARSSLMQLHQLPEAHYLTTVSFVDYGEHLHLSGPDKSSKQANGAAHNQLIAVHPTIAHLERASGQITKQLTVPLGNQVNSHQSVKTSSRHLLIKHWHRLSNRSSLSAAGNDGLDYDKPMKATLEINNLNRANLNDEFMCLANNNNFSIPLNTTVKLNLNLKPTEVRIISKTANNTFKLGQKAIIECQVSGSKPSASIRWFRGSEELTMLKSRASDRQPDGYSSIDDNQAPLQQVARVPSTTGHQSQEETSYISEFNRDINNNLTKISYLTLIPRLSDNQQSLTCSANNLKLPNSPTISDTIQMNVQFAPRLNLQLNTNIRPDSIKIGGDIFMECNVEANPAVDEITWLLNDEALNANVSLGIIMSNQSLVLQRIRIEQRGQYQCVARNSIGRSESNKLELRPKFEPICDYSLTKRRYEIPVNQPTRIECNVLAEPGEDLHFVWHFNQTFGAHFATPDDGTDNDTDEPDTSSSAGAESSYHIEEIRQFETNFTKSSVIFTPKKRRHYGQLLCSASNSMGKQERPCVIQVVGSELPDPVINCFTDSQTQFSFSVHCQPPANSLSSPSAAAPSSPLDRGASGLGGSSGVHYILELYQDDPANGSADGQASTHLKSRQPALELDSTAEGGGQRNLHDLIRQHHQPNRIKKLISKTPSFNVSDLRPNTSYHLQVFVRNSRGLSLPAYHQASTRQVDGAFAAGYNQFGDKDDAKRGRVEFSKTGKRMSVGGDEATGASDDPSFSAKLISYLKLDNYLSRQSFKQETHQMVPLAGIGFILLLCLLSMTVVAIFIRKMCRSSRQLSSHEGQAKHDSRAKSQSTSYDNKSKRQKSSLCKNAANDDAAQQVDHSSTNPRGLPISKSKEQSVDSTGTSSRSMTINSTSGNRHVTINNLGAKDTGVLSSAMKTIRSRTTLGVGVGSGSDTSRETNTDSTLISSPQTTLTNNASGETSSSMKNTDGQEMGCYIIGKTCSDSMKRRGIMGPGNRLVQNHQQSYEANGTPLADIGNASIRSSSTSSRHGAFQAGNPSNFAKNDAFRLNSDMNQPNMLSTSSSSSPYTTSHQQTICLGSLATNDHPQQHLAASLSGQLSSNTLTSEPVYLISQDGLLQSDQLDVFPSYHQHLHDHMSNESSDASIKPNWMQHQGSALVAGDHTELEMVAEPDRDQHFADSFVEAGRCQLVDGHSPGANLIGYNHHCGPASNDQTSIGFIPNSISIPIGLSDRLNVLGRGYPRNDSLQHDRNCCSRMETSHQEYQQLRNSNGGSYLTLINHMTTPKSDHFNQGHRYSASGSPFDNRHTDRQPSQPEFNYFTLGNRNVQNGHSFRLINGEGHNIAPPEDFVNDFRRFKQTFGIDSQRDQQDNNIGQQTIDNQAELFAAELKHANCQARTEAECQSLGEQTDKINPRDTAGEPNRPEQQSAGCMDQTIGLAAKTHRVKFEN